jgi:hypothetical protein
MLFLVMCAFSSITAIHSAGFIAVIGLGVSVVLLSLVGRGS